MQFRRLLILEYGPPEVLQMVEGELPDPGARQVCLRVLAAGVSFSDILMRRGLYPGQTRPPFTPGFEIVGEIDSVGPGVQGFRPGQHVCALTVYGGYSELLVLPGRDLFSMPDGLNPAEAAAIPLNYVAAAQMLHRIARVPRGGKILVHGAAGGVGTALVQLATFAGISVYGTASREKHPLLEQLGVIPIDRRNSFRDDLRIHLGTKSAAGVDAVFDSIGPSHWKHDWQVLRPGGRLVIFGSQSRCDPERPASSWQDRLALTQLRLTGGRRQVHLYSLLDWKKEHPDWYRQDLMQMLHFLKDGKIKPVIGQTFPWTDAAQAHALIEQRKLEGKAILTF